MKILQLNDLFPNIELFNDIIKFKQYGFLITKTNDNNPALQFPFYNDDCLDERFKFEISEENLFYLISNFTLFKGFIQKNLFVIENDNGQIEVLPMEHQTVKTIIKNNKKKLIPGKQILDLKSSFSFQKQGFKKVYFGKIKSQFSSQSERYYFGIYNKENILVDTETCKTKPICLIDKDIEINLYRDQYSKLSKFYTYI